MTATQTSQDIARDLRTCMDPEESYLLTEEFWAACEREREADKTDAIAPIPTDFPF